jgi:hypothetical protein
MGRSLIVGDAGAGQRLRNLSIKVQLLFLKHPTGVLLKAILSRDLSDLMMLGKKGH